MVFKLSETQNRESKKIYKDFNNKHKSLLCKAERDYYKTSFEMNKNNCKKTRKLIYYTDI